MSQFLIHKTTTCLDCSGTGIVVRPTLAGLPQNSIEPQTCLCLLCAGEGIEHREMELYQMLTRFSTTDAVTARDSDLITPRRARQI